VRSPEVKPGKKEKSDLANGGIRREPMLPDCEDIAPETPSPADQFAGVDDEPADEAIRAKRLNDLSSGLARQAALDRGDGLEM